MDYDQFEDALSNMQDLSRWSGWKPGDPLHIRADIEAAEPRANGIFDSVQQCWEVLAQLCRTDHHRPFLIKWLQYGGVALLNLNARIQWPGTLLNHAIFAGNLDLIALLLKMGADPCLRDGVDKGVDSLFLAGMIGLPPVYICLLLDYKANPNTTCGGMSLLGFLAQRLNSPSLFNSPSRDREQSRYSSTSKNVTLQNMKVLLRYKANLCQVQPFSLLRQNQVTALQLLQSPRVRSTGRWKKTVIQIRLLWENGPHPDQRWRRRKAFLVVLAEHGLRPLAAADAELHDGALPPSVLIPPLRGPHQDLVRDRVLSHRGVVALIAQYL